MIQFHDYIYLFKGNKIRSLKKSWLSCVYCNIIDTSQDSESTEVLVSCWHGDDLDT